MLDTFRSLLSEYQPQSKEDAKSENKQLCVFGLYEPDSSNWPWTKLGDKAESTTTSEEVPLIPPLTNLKTLLL